MAAMASAATHPAADPRGLAGDGLTTALRDSRATTLARTFDLASWDVPQQPGVNRIDWELGHLAWFAEFWILRGPHRASDDGRFVEAAKPARIAGPDAVFDSSKLGHAERWRTPMPSRATLAERLETQLEACIAAIPDDAGDDDANYWHRLVLLHEDMHGEAFAWLRDTLGLPAPAGLPRPATFASAPPLRLDGGEVALGRRSDDPGFAFDNERPGRRVRVAPFEIDSAPVTNRAYAEYLAATGAVPPERWSRGADGGWCERRFDRVEPLLPDAPVVHVDAFEAEAWCRWRGRRLPSAAEWETAAADPSLQWGRSVWEWTADDFAPYPGFEPGPYRDYSAPWFCDHRELRGGSFATPERLHDRRFRNFFTAGRRDVFAGFRSARSLDPTGP